MDKFIDFFRKQVEDVYNKPETIKVFCTAHEDLPCVCIPALVINLAVFLLISCFKLDDVEAELEIIDSKAIIRICDKKRRLIGVTQEEFSTKDIVTKDICLRSRDGQIYLKLHLINENNEVIDSETKSFFISLEGKKTNSNSIFDFLLFLLCHLRLNEMGQLSKGVLAIYLFFLPKQVFPLFIKFTEQQNSFMKESLEYFSVFWRDYFIFIQRMQEHYYKNNEKISLSLFGNEIYNQYHLYINDLLNEILPKHQESAICASIESSLKENVRLYKEFKKQLHKLKERLFKESEKTGQELEEAEGLIEDIRREHYKHKNRVYSGPC